MRSVVFTAIATAIVVSACSQSPSAGPFPTVVPDDAPSYDTGTALMAALVDAGLECADIRAFDPADGYVLTYQPPEGRLCERAQGDVYVYLYASAEDRQSARNNGEVSICRLADTARAYDALVGANWRVASTDPNVIINQLAIDLPHGAVETASCLSVE